MTAPATSTRGDSNYSLCFVLPLHGLRLSVHLQRSIDVGQGGRASSFPPSLLFRLNPPYTLLVMFGSWQLYPLCSSCPSKRCVENDPSASGDQRTQPAVTYESNGCISDRTQRTTTHPHSYECLFFYLFSPAAGPQHTTTQAHKHTSTQAHNHAVMNASSSLSSHLPQSIGVVRESMDDHIDPFHVYRVYIGCMGCIWGV